MAMKFSHKIDEEVTYNFVINHFYSKHHFYHATHQTTESVRKLFQFAL